MRISALVGLSFCAFTLFGCGGSSEPRLPTIPVKGTVYVDDKPFGPCMVLLSSLEADSADTSKLAAIRTVTGKVAADGTFSLRTYADNDGAPEGSYSVTISSTPPEMKVGVDATGMTMKPVPPCEPLTVSIKKPADGKPLQLDVKLKSTGEATGGAGTMGGKMMTPGM